jgi:signal transduction histidine kinase
VIWSASEPPWLGRVDRWTRSHGWAADALLALACVAVLGALSLSGAQDLRWPIGWAVALAACFAVLHLTVVLRSHAPEVGYVLAGAAMLVVVLAPDGRVIDPVANGPTAVSALFLPSSLVFLVDLYAVASRTDAMRSRLALGAALAGVGIATWSSGDVLRDYAGGGALVSLYFALALAVGVLLTWNLGRLALVRRERVLAERAESAGLAVLEERARIAREMHDIVAHTLAVIVRQAEGGAFVAGRDPEQAAQTLRTIADAGRDALANMRGLVGVLRDPAAASGPPQPTLADLPALVAGLRDTGVDAELVETGGRFPVSAATELAGYRVAQEGLTNAVKHAGPGAHVAVVVDWQPSALTVEVTDDGGTAPGPLRVPGAGAGLPGLRDRIAAAGGTFTADRLDRGFRLRGCFPRTAAGRAR